MSQNIQHVVVLMLENRGFDHMLGFMKASKEMAEKGTFSEFANGFPGGELNKMFK